MRLNGLILAPFLFLSLTHAAIAAAPTTFHFTEKPGPSPVGLKVVEQYDYSRVYRPLTDDLGKPSTGERARPLQTLIWYPAQKSSQSPMSVGDYAQLLSSETSFGKTGPPSDWKKWIAGATSTFEDKMWAMRNAAPAAGRFPVVIYAPSFSSMSWENADLCELLASHGYVVVASPDMGVSTRNMTADLAGINAQARDISFLIGYAQTLPDTDMSAVAVAGFSWGGISNLFAAARDSRIDALVALDGSMRYYPGIVKQAGDVHPEQLTIPLLYFTQGEIPLEDSFISQPSPEETGPSVLNAWTHGDLITVHDLAFTHREHSSMYQRDESMWKDYAEEQKADYPREDGIPGYAWVCRYTLNFLNAYLKHDSAALAFLKKTPAENGVAPHFLATSFRAAKGAPASFEAFRAAVGMQGFDHAAAIYASMKRKTADFKLGSNAMNDWSNRLIQTNHSPEAIDLLKLTIQNDPDSSNAYTLLGDAYAQNGDRQQARDNYNKALEKEPENTEVKDKLKKLDTPAPAPK